MSLRVCSKNRGKAEQREGSGGGLNSLRSDSAWRKASSIGEEIGCGDGEVGAGCGGEPE